MGLFPVRLFVKLFKVLVTYSILPTCSAPLNLLDSITLTILSSDTNYEDIKPSPLPILIPLGPKYSPQDPVFKYP